MSQLIPGFFEQCSFNGEKVTTRTCAFDVARKLSSTLTWVLSTAPWTCATMYSVVLRRSSGSVNRTVT